MTRIHVESSINAAEILASQLPPDVAEAVLVRISNVNDRTGRCDFKFGRPEDWHGPTKVAVGVILDNNRWTDRFYVIPANLCPSTLFVKPGDENSKWHLYFVDGKKLKVSDVIIDIVKKKSDGSVAAEFL